MWKNLKLLFFVNITHLCHRKPVTLSPQNLTIPLVTEKNSCYWTGALHFLGLPMCLELNLHYFPKRSQVPQEGVALS